jgi:hypothetical protein
MLLARGGSGIATALLGIASDSGRAVVDAPVDAAGQIVNMLVGSQEFPGQLLALRSPLIGQRSPRDDC